MKSSSRRSEGRNDDLETRLQALEKDNARLRRALSTAQEQQNQYRLLFEALPMSVYVVDRRGIIIDVNLFHLSNMGRGLLRKEDYVGKPFSSRSSLAAAGLLDEFARVLKGTPFSADGVHFPSVSGGGEGYFNIRGVPLKHNKVIVGAIFLSEDVTMLKKAQDELTVHKERLEELVKARTSELTDALARVKTLSGFIPICASCKKVRDDKGYWTQVEAYIAEHSEIEFSHGLCPDCLKRLYPNLTIQAP